MNERQRLHHSQSEVVFIFDYGRYKNEKFVSLTDSDVQTFLEGEENQNTKKKNRKLRIEWLW